MKCASRFEIKSCAEARMLAVWAILFWCASSYVFVAESTRPGKWSGTDPVRFAVYFSDAFVANVAKSRLEPEAVVVDFVRPLHVDNRTLMSFHYFGMRGGLDQRVHEALSAKQDAEPKPIDHEGRAYAAFVTDSKKRVLICKSGESIQCTSTTETRLVYLYLMNDVLNMYEEYEPQVWVDKIL